MLLHAAQGERMQLGVLLANGKGDDLRRLARFMGVELLPKEKRRDLIRKLRDALNKQQIADMIRDWEKLK